MPRPQPTPRAARDKLQLGYASVRSERPARLPARRCFGTRPRQALATALAARRRVTRSSGRGGKRVTTEDGGAGRGGGPCPPRDCRRPRQRRRGRRGGPQRGGSPGADPATRAPAPPSRIHLRFHGSSCSARGLSEGRRTDRTASTRYLGVGGLSGRIMIKPAVLTILPGLVATRGLPSGDSAVCVAARQALPRTLDSSDASLDGCPGREERPCKRRRIQPAKAPPGPSPLASKDSNTPPATEGGGDRDGGGVEHADHQPGRRLHKGETPAAESPSIPSPFHPLCHAFYYRAPLRHKPSPHLRFWIPPPPSPPHLPDPAKANVK